MGLFLLTLTCWVLGLHAVQDKSIEVIEPNPEACSEKPAFSLECTKPIKIYYYDRDSENCKSKTTCPPEEYGNAFATRESCESLCEEKLVDEEESEEGLASDLNDEADDDDTDDKSVEPVAKRTVYRYPYDPYHPNSRPCPYGWIKTYYGCHLYHTVQYTYHEALRFCQSQGAHLVTIDSEGEARAHQNHIKTKASRDYWIGATDEYTEGYWRWSHKNRPLKPGFTKWQTGEPNNLYGNEHCVHLGLWDNYHWNDVLCTNKKYALCEMSYRHYQASLDHQPVCPRLGRIKTKSFPCQASSEYSSQWSCKNAFDGDSANFHSEWASRGQGSGAWIKLDFPFKVGVTELRFVQRTNTHEANKGINIQFSNGKTTYYTLVDPKYGMKTTLPFDRANPIFTDYLKITIKSVYGNINNGFREIEVYGCV